MGIPPKMAPTKYIITLWVEVSSQASLRSWGPSHTYIYVCVYTYVYTHMYIYTHTHTHNILFLMWSSKMFYPKRLDVDPYTSYTVGLSYTFLSSPPAQLLGKLMIKSTSSFLWWYWKIQTMPPWAHRQELSLRNYTLTTIKKNLNPKPVTFFELFSHFKPT